MRQPNGGCAWRWRRARAPTYAAREVRKRLKAIERSSTYLDSAKRKTLCSELEGHLSTICGSIRRDNPSLALDLHWELLELSEGIFDRCYDGSGAMSSFFRKVLQSLAASLQAAQPKPAATAERLVDALEDCNGYGQLDPAVDLLAEALGTEGLEALRRECLGRAVPEGAPVLLAIADALGDVESYVAAFDADDLQWPPNAAAVATRLVQAGRAQEALAVVRGVRLQERAWMAGLLSDPHIAALEALGRSSEAQQLRWDWGGLPEQRQFLLDRVRARQYTANPFALLGICDDPELHQIAARAYTRETLPLAPAAKPPPAAPRDKLRIGYFLG